MKALSFGFSVPALRSGHRRRVGYGSFAEGALNASLYANFDRSYNSINGYDAQTN